MIHYSLKKNQSDAQEAASLNLGSSEFEEFKKERKKMLAKKAALVLMTLVFAVVITGGYLIYKTNSTFDKVTGEENSVFKSFIKMLPFGGSFFQVLPVEGEEGTIDKIKSNRLERLNILLLGMRGVGDPNGGLLTDTIMVVSVKPRTGEVALISIPRDLYVKMPYHNNYKGKINEAYELGMKNKGWKEGLKYSKKVVSDVTGLDIHYAVSVDFKAFKEIIDTLGGITIYLDKPFSEKNQFAEGAIELPAGRQVIDGSTALLFVRARFSSSDFDRARRQQQVLLAIKEKAFSLGVLSNPMKIISILNSIGNHIRTDAKLWEIQELAVMARRMDMSNVKRKVFDTSPNGLLYASRDQNGSYILLPRGGNFDRIREACRNIFEN